ncbi:MAG TPA: RNA polymerase sigma factor [Anaerolineales bacterium]|jgi:RNA polymerase sigma-70 factor (ECF subfamily)
MMTGRSNDDWLNDLRAGADLQARALEDLRVLILRGLPYALAGKLKPDSPEFEALAEEVAQETLLRVLAKLDLFEGRSAFTTWVYKIAVREALGQLRRRRWQDVPLPDMEMNEDTEPALPEMADERQVDPGKVAERNDLMVRLKSVMMEELTGKQRMALMLVAMQDMPLDAAAVRMGMNRNALYKLMHDARLRLKRRLQADGLNPQEILASFAEAPG